MQVGVDNGCLMRNLILIITILILIITILTLIISTLIMIITILIILRLQDEKQPTAGFTSKR